MNHLAHAFLAADTPASIVGSLAGDFVRGPLHCQFDPAIAAGIRLHRQVDTYTDSHVITRRGRKRFVGAQRRVAGVVLDVLYDHFLIQHWEEYSNERFNSFCTRIYSTLKIHQATAPEHFRNYIPRFVERDLLASCCTVDGVAKVLQRLASRWERKPELHDLLLRAGDDAWNYRNEIEEDFRSFFPQLIYAAEGFKSDSVRN